MPDNGIVKDQKKVAGGASSLDIEVYIATRTMLVVRIHDADVTVRGFTLP